MISSRDLVDATLVSGSAITADGSRALYLLARTVGGRVTTEAWVHPLGADGPPPFELSIDGIEALIPGPDPDRVVVVATSDGTSRLVVADLVGGTARELLAVPTEMPGGVAIGSAAIGDVVWSPEGRRLAYVVHVAGPDADRPAYVDVAEHVRVIRTPGYEEDGIGPLPVATAQLMTIDVGSGEVRRVSSTPHDHDSPSFSPDGRWIAARRYAGVDTYHADIVLFDLDAEGDVAPEPIDEGGVVDWASWSPDGHRLALSCRSTDPPSPARELRVFDRRNGELRTVASDPPGEPLDPALWIDDSTILVHAMRRSMSSLFVLDLSSGDVATRAEFEAGHVGFSVDRGGRVAIQSRETLRGFGEVVAVDLRSGETRSLVDPNRSLLESAEVAPPQRLQVSSEGCMIDVSVLRPAGEAPDTPLPTVFALHGGPNEAWGGDFVDVAFLLASNGYQVAMPNVRGSVGYGRAFAEAEQADYGGGEIRDLMAVVDAITDLPGSDRDRLGITGGSHGGYLTALAIARSDRFAAAVCARPLIDLAPKWATSDSGAYWGDLYFGGAPWDRPDLYRERSPATHAHHITTPTLIVAGEHDLRCKVDQAKQLFTILHRVGCETELVLYPDASHGFGEAGAPREQRIDYFERLLGWFDRYLRDR